jgi:hypothetical protein
MHKDDVHAGRAATSGNAPDAHLSFKPVKGQIKFFS